MFYLYDNYQDLKKVKFFYKRSLGNTFNLNFFKREIASSFDRMGPIFYSFKILFLYKLFVIKSRFSSLIFLIISFIKVFFLKEPMIIKK